MDWLDMDNLSFNILVMLQRGQGMSSPKRNPFYFMLMVRKVSVVDKEAVGEEVAAINFKFLLFKGKRLITQGFRSSIKQNSRYRSISRQTPTIRARSHCPK